MTTFDKILAPIEKGLNKAVLYLLSTVFLTMLVLAVTQVVMRKFLLGWIWIDSLDRTLVVWVGMLGAVLAAQENRHLTTDVLTHFLPDGSRSKLWLTFIVSMFLILIAGLATVFSWQFYRDGMQFDATTEVAPGLSAARMNLIYPVGFFLIGLNYFFKVLRSVPHLLNTAVKS